MGVPDDSTILVDDDYEVMPLGAGEIMVRALVFNLGDGHQRIVAARERLEDKQTTHPMLIKFIFGLSDAEQRSVFYQSNRNQTPVSTQVHLRNIDNIAAAVELRAMASRIPGFPRLKMDQLRRRGEEITVRMLYEAAVLLHGYRPNSPEDILDALEDLTQHIGVPQIIENTQTFFEVLTACFTGNVKDKGPHPLSRYVYRRDLMGGLAVLFAQFEDFWSKRNPVKLLVIKSDINKLRGVSNKSVEQALGASSALRATFEVLQYRMNGARTEHPLTQRVQPWKRSSTPFTNTPGTDEGEENDGEA